MGIPGVRTHRLLNCVNVPSLRASCGLSAFVETGILDGDGIAVGLHYGFERIYSCDIDPSAIDRAKRRFPQNSVRLVLGDSRQFIRDMAERINDPTLFWLDAHFPDHAAGEVGEFPLLDELVTLKTRAAIGRDVIVCDDMRIIPGEDNPTFTETHPDIAVDPGRYIQRHLALRMLWGPFEEGHDVYLVCEETGVLLMVPRGTPYQGHFRWRILRRPRMIRLN